MLKLKRRAILTAAVMACGPRARAATPTRRLAIFSSLEPEALMSPNGENRYYRAFFEELARQGYVVGRTLDLERYGRETIGPAPEAAGERLVRSAPDAVYLISGFNLVINRTNRTPIVVLTPDPIRLGLTGNLARPGGNITGVSIDAGRSIFAKQLALLREAVPGLARIAVLGLRGVWSGIGGVGGFGGSRPVQGDDIRQASAEAGLEIVEAPIDPPNDEAAYRSAFAAALEQKPDAMLAVLSPNALINRKLIVELSNAARLPTIFGLPEFVEAGGLMAYSFDLVELNHHAARQVAVILRGGSPSEIPFYQPTNFILSLNLQTADEMGLQLPTTLIARAAIVVQ